ncbi:hypothetical protein BT69DRAFT_1281416, partial [Atractiella rhizophila]
MMEDGSLHLTERLLSSKRDVLVLGCYGKRIPFCFESLFDLVFLSFPVCCILPRNVLRDAMWVQRATNLHKYTKVL